MPPPEDQELGRSLFSEMVEMKTTHDVGSTDLAQAIREHLLRAGFPSEDVVVVAPPDHPTKGNVVVRYRGKGKSQSRGKPVLFLGHLDVVEAKAEDWSVDPFRFTEKDGFFYGRGTIDMKEGIAALVETLIRLKRERFTPERDVIVAMTADEEAGGDANGPAFLLKNHRDLIDAELAINLDGGGGEYRNGKRLSYSMGTSEKSYVTYSVEATSPGGHGSLPGPGNPIYRLAAALSRLEAYKFPVMLTATTRSNFAQTADLEPSAQSADLHAVSAAQPDLPAAGRLSENVSLNAHLRTTCVATLISGGHAENALPQRK
jgi:acetylornithine deacetylase/succinyl-diaminopimelate desuccinylase-like protein